MLKHLKNHISCWRTAGEPRIAGRLLPQEDLAKLSVSVFLVRGCSDRCWGPMSHPATSGGLDFRYNYRQPSGLQSGLQVIGLWSRSHWCCPRTGNPRPKQVSERSLHPLYVQKEALRMLTQCTCKVQSGTTSGHPSPACRDKQLSKQGAHLSGNEESCAS